MIKFIKLYWVSLLWVLIFADRLVCAFGNGEWAVAWFSFTTMFFAFSSNILLVAYRRETKEINQFISDRL